MSESRPPAAPALEIVTIGDELLLGETVDHNSAWLGRRLAAEGIRVARRATVGDDEDAIAAAVREALDRTGTVLCTGGLGPTPDDLTRPAVARLFGRRLLLDPALLEALRARFRARGLEMPEINRTQAEVPEGATIFPNPYGTAPGLALQDERGRLAILLPGVPRELHAIVAQHVIPFLRARWRMRSRPIRHRVLRTTGIPESALAERIAPLLPQLAPLRVAFLPDPTGVDLRITSWGELDAEAADRALDTAEALLRPALGHHLYGRDDEDLADAAVEVVAECGPEERLTDRPGASAYFHAAVVAYADAAKETILGVRRATLAAHGAVSEATAREMLDGVRRLTGTETAIAVTGIAGPGGGSPEKPVGTVWIAAAAGTATDARLHRFGGDRTEIRERAAQAALALLYELLHTRP